MFEIFSIQLSYSFSSLFAFCFCFRLVVCHISFVFKCITLFPTKKTIRSGQLLAVWELFLATVAAVGQNKRLCYAAHCKTDPLATVPLLLSLEITRPEDRNQMPKWHNGHYCLSIG